MAKGGAWRRKREQRLWDKAKREKEKGKVGSDAGIKFTLLTVNLNFNYRG